MSTTPPPIRRLDPRDVDDEIDLPPAAEDLAKLEAALRELIAEQVELCTDARADLEAARRMAPSPARDAAVEIAERNVRAHKHRALALNFSLILLHGGPVPPGEVRGLSS